MRTIIAVLLLLAPLSHAQEQWGCPRKMPTREQIFQLAIERCDVAVEYYHGDRTACIVDTIRMWQPQIDRCLGVMEKRRQEEERARKELSK